eukprot:Skav208005  [mRNA]  locus=scaffold1203:253232:254104:+ [translate_table: standard]
MALQQCMSTSHWMGEVAEVSPTSTSKSRNAQQPRTVCLAELLFPNDSLAPRAARCDDTESQHKHEVAPIGCKPSPGPLAFMTRSCEQQLEAAKFDMDLLEHAMCMFSTTDDCVDLQVDWSATGLGFVTTGVLTSASQLMQPRTRDTTTTITSRFATQSGKTTSAEPSATATVVFQVGQRIVLRDLADISCNGLKGEIITATTSTGRYGIRLESGRRVSIRPQNLETIKNDKCEELLGQSPVRGDPASSEPGMFANLNLGDLLKAQQQPQRLLRQQAPFKFPPGTARQISY